MKSPRLIRFLLLAAFVVVMSGVAYLIWQTNLNYQEAARDREEVARALDVLKQLESFVDAVQELEQHKQYLLLTGEPPYQQRYNKASDNLIRELTKLVQAAIRVDVPLTELNHVRDLTNQLLAQNLTLFPFVPKSEAVAPRVRADLKPSLALYDSILVAIARYEQRDREFLRLSNNKRKVQVSRVGWYVAGLSMLLFGFVITAFLVFGMDMRNRYRHTLHQRKAESIINNITDPILITDAAFELVEWNGFATNLYELPSDRKRRAEAPIFLSSLFVDRTQAEQVMGEILESGGWAGEYNHFGQGKFVRIVQLSCTSLHDYRGRFSGAVIQVRDVSDQRAADAQVKYLANLVAASTDAIFSTNMHQVIRSWNQAAEQLYGMTEQNAIGKILPVLMPNIEEHYAARSADGGMISEMTIQMPGGKRLHVLGTTSPVFDMYGQQTGFVHFHRDISVRKQLEEQLRKFNLELSDQVQLKTQEYLNLLERIDDGFLAFDHDWRYTYVNKKAAEILGLDIENAIGKIIWELFPEATTYSFYQFYLQAKEQQRQLFVEEFYEPLKRWLEYVIYPSSTGLTVFIRDVTERKQQQLVLYNSEEQRRLIMNAAPDAIVTFDWYGRIMFWNPQATQIFGYAEQEMLGRRVEEQILRWNEAEEAPVAENLPFQVELFAPALTQLMERIGYRKNGSAFPMELRILQIEQGDHAFYCAFIRDITERKQAATRLELEKRRFRELIDKLSAGVIVHNASGKIVLFNERAQEILNEHHPRWLDQFLNNQAVDWQLVDEHFQPLPNSESAVNQVLATGRPVRNRVLGTLTHTPGEVKWVLINAYPEFDQEGAIHEVIVNFMDITEQMEAQQQLAISEERLNRVLLAMNEGWWEHDLETDYFYGSPRWYAILGYEPHELPRDSSAWAQIRHASDQSADATRIAQSVADGKDIYSIETRLRHRAGHDIPILSRGFIQRNKAGKPIRISGINIDLTEIKSAEAKLQEAYEAQRAMAAHLERIREEERAGIAREIHDELGQLLTGFRMDIFWLIRHLPDATPAIREKLDDCVEGLDHSMRSVRSIVSQLRPALLDDLGLSAALEWQADTFAKRYGIATFFQAQVPVLPIRKEVATLFFRIFQEALTNIARHAQATEVEAHFTLEDNSLLLTIEDNGCGFDKQQLESKKTLGILSMKERTLLLEGTFHIESQPDGGTFVQIKASLNHCIETT